MTKLILVRHGQSMANIDKVIAGSNDSPLTELGIMQAQKTARYIKDNYTIDKAYASSLTRAFCTGKAIADEFGLETVPVPDLREIDCGVWQGMDFGDIKQQYPKEYNQWNTDIGSFEAINGESSKDVYDRVSKAIVKIADENDGKTVAIAGHSFALRGIVPIMPFFTSEYSDLCELADSFKSKDVGICWDTGHANLMDFDQAQAIKYVGDRIKCTHMHNNNKYCDSHDDVDVGNIEWAKVMEAFKEIGYAGPLTLETHCQYPDEEVLKSFYRHNFLGLEYLERLMK